MGASCVKKSNINAITPCVIYPRKSRSGPLMHVKVISKENTNNIQHNKTLDNKGHYRPILNKLLEKKMINNYIKRGIVNTIS